MRPALVSFALGCAWLQWQAALPPWWMIGLLALAAAGLTALPPATGLRHHIALVSAAACLGVAWAAGLAHWRLADELPTAWEGRDVEVIGVISSLPQPFERGVRFEFSVDTTLTPEALVPQRLQLAWYGGFGAGEIDSVAPVHAGERWRLTVRLKKPHGNANPHLFDYEAFLLERGIRATGYVRPAARKGGNGGSTGVSNGVSNVRLAPFVWTPGTVVDRTRERIRDRLTAALDGAPYAGVIIALTVGDQRAIDSDDWQLFTRTGVGHLMSISGLHVTMIASLAAWIVMALWRRSETLMLWLPAPKAAAGAGFGAALVYCLLAGFGVPAQRTLYMLGVAAWALWRGWFGSGSRVLAIALGIVCVLDPWAPLSAGFWLSFGAVALLLVVGNTRHANTHWFSAAVRAQLAITLGLTPLTLALFNQVSLAGPLANALAIPVVSFIVTPLALFAAVIPVDAIAHAAHWVMEWLMRYLDWLGSFEWAVWQRAAPPLWAIVLAIAGSLWCLIPWPLAWRLQGVAWMLPLLLLPAPKPADGDLWLTVLDVGQGLAIVARSREHTLLYDTGPRYSPEADSGNRVVLPYLRATGVNRLDGMIVTHDDIDHSGGALSVLQGIPVDWLASPLAATHPVVQAASHSKRCIAGEKWTWEGVHFETLHPRADDYARLDADNLASAAGGGTGVATSNATRTSGARKNALKDNATCCVLRVTAHGRSVLLSADIEADVESQLVSSGAPLKSDVLIAPHHGSKTSSTPAFLAAVKPDTIVIPVGYRNRFRHPAPEVWARYTDSGAQLLRTDALGAVTLRFTPEGIVSSAQRTEQPRYWHQR